MKQLKIKKYNGLQCLVINGAKNDIELEHIYGVINSALNKAGYLICTEEKELK